MIKLINLLKEIYDKNLVGSEYGEGGQHIIYNYGNDKVIKFNHEGGEIGYNLKIFTEHPDIFPKVYDMGEDYAILEKLDDNKFGSEVWKIKRILHNNAKSLSSDTPPKNPYIAKLLQRSRITGPDYYDNDITELIYDNLEDNKLKEEFQKELPSDLYDSLIKNYYPLLQKVKNISWNSKHKKDVNDENFGYNSNGELKMLDI
jgi:hypothetical protein